MSEDYNWSVRTKPFYIPFKPLELLVAKLAQAAGLKIKDIDQPDEMDAVLIEAIPTGTLGFDALQLSLPVSLPPSLSTSCSPGT